MGVVTPTPSFLCGGCAATHSACQVLVMGSSQHLSGAGWCRISQRLSGASWLLSSQRLSGAGWLWNSQRLSGGG